MSEHLPDVDVVCCSFCGVSNRGELSHLVLIKSGTADICDRCVSTCVQVLAENYAQTTVGQLSKRSTGCPVIFEKGQLGTCTACGKTFECGAIVPSTTEGGPT